MANGPMGPTVPNDIKNDTIMRAWYQAMWSTVRDLHNERISVTDYGATGDGVTDDTTAFNAALAVADAQTKVLWIPQGRYKITSTITIANPVTILGEGETESVIEPYLGTSGGDVFLVTSSDVTMKDFGFDGDNVGTVTLTNNMYMIHVNPTSGTLDRFYFEHLRFRNFDFSAGAKDVSTESSIRAAYAIKIEDSNYVCVENCYVDNISGGFVYTTGVSYLNISKNYIEDALLHPICIHDTTYHFNIADNYFNPIDTTGVFLGGLIDVTSATGTQCHHGNIEGNHVAGTISAPGYVSYGAVFRVMSSNNINITNNHIGKVNDGSLNSDTDFTEVPYIRIGTIGTSSSDDNGPCSYINISSNHLDGPAKVTNAWRTGILIENNYQTSAVPAHSINIVGNSISSTSTSYFFTHGITLNGKSSGIQNVVIENNQIVAYPANTNPTSYAVAGRGIVSFVSTDSTGACHEIFVGGNRIESLSTAPGIIEESGLVVGQYTYNVVNTKPNYIYFGEYGVVVETGATAELWYLDNNIVVPSGFSSGSFLFNVQPRSYHTNTSGATASRPTSTSGLTNYMTFFDTTLGTPLWYNGSTWVGAWGSADSIAETISDQVGTMVTGNTETGITVTYQDSDNTLDFVVSDTTVTATSGSTALTPGDTLTVVGASGISTAISGDTLTITGTTAAPVGASYLTLGTDATLTSERVLTAGTNITFTDGGAGSTLTINASGGSGSPGGSDTQVQFNDAAAFGGDSGLTYNKTTNVLTCDTQVTIGGNATASGILKFLEDSDNGSNYVNLTIAQSLAADYTLTLPSATDTLVGRDTTDTFTNKTWNGAVIGLAYGGTNANLTASNGGIFYSTGTAGAILSGTATAGQILQSGSSSAPSWSTATYPATAGSAGKILRSDGTNLVSSTATFADTYTASNLLYSNGSNTVTGLATGNDGVLITSATGVPSISSTIPSATQDNITRTGTVTSGTWSATTIAVDKGGTGQTSYTNGQLLIGNTTGNTLTKSTLTAGSNITITNGSGSITIAATGGSPGGSDTQVQFNDSSAFGGDSGLTYNKTTNVLTCDTQINIGGNATSSGVLRLLEDTDNGSNYIEIKPPAAVTANTTLTLPDGAGTNLNFLQTNGSGTLSWANPTTATTSTLGVASFSSNDFTVSSGAVSLSQTNGFRAYRSTNQSVSSGVYTKVQCDTENFDIGSDYDNATNYRFTPTVAGYYFVYGNVGLVSMASAKQLVVSLALNGTAIFQSSAAQADTVGNSLFWIPACGVVYLNGSTDYMELFVYNGDSVSRSAKGADEITNFGAFRLSA